MKLFKAFAVVIILFFAVISCSKEADDQKTIEVTGIIQPQEITYYQYGTHTIQGYALRSSTLNLDDYVGQQVTVVGYTIEGYPVEGGPDYLEVIAVK